ncbi:MAG TPA: hypothetical protein VFA75_14575 [Nevskia sp.]|nr:hypothetical protein [Nevskia sp.]
MACCAFIAFLIGQCLAAFQSWRGRLARLFGLKPREGKPFLARRWRNGLVAALVIELGLAAGAAIAAGLAPGGSGWSALCGAGAALAGN